MKTLSLLCLLALAHFLSGCSGMLKGKEASEQGVVDFHQQFNDGKMREIYAATDAKFKKASPEQEFVDLLATVQRKLGQVTASERTNFSINTMNGTTRVVLVQNTTFEHGSGTERFTFEMNGEKAVLLGWNVNSKDLIMK